MTKAKRPVKTAKRADGKTGEPAAVWVPTESLKPWKRNPRKITDAAVDQLAASIKRFGFGNAIVAREANSEVIAGHTRLRAAKKLRMPLVPVRFLNLGLEEAHLLALADNKLGELVEWDDDAVAAILEDYKRADQELAGFDEDDLESPSGDDGGADFKPIEIDEQFSIIIECDGETEQVKLLERFQKEGLKCRALI